MDLTRVFTGFRASTEAAVEKETSEEGGRAGAPGSR